MDTGGGSRYLPHRHLALPDIYPASRGTGFVWLSANWRMRAEDGLQIRRQFKGKTRSLRAIGRVQYAIEFNEDSPHLLFSMWACLKLPW